MKNTSNTWTIVRSTPGCTEPRFNNVMQQLSSLGISTNQITWDRTRSGNETHSDNLDYQFKLRTPFGQGLKNLTSHLRFQIFLWKRLQVLSPAVVYACDLDTFLTSLVWVKLHRRKIIFDQFDPISSRFHEIFQLYFDYVEYILALQADLRISANVNRNRNKAAWFEFPNFFPISDLKSRGPSQERILIYGGVLQPDRGLIAVADQIRDVPDWNFCIYGEGPDFKLLQEITSKQKNIFLNHRVNHEQLMESASHSWIYLALYDPTFAHNRRTASNKLFEAAQLRVPLIASKGTHLGDIIEEFDLGWTVEFNKLHDLNLILDERGAWEATDLVKFENRCKIFLDQSNYENLISNYRMHILTLLTN